MHVRIRTRVRTRTHTHAHTEKGGEGKPGTSFKFRNRFYRILLADNGESCKLWMFFDFLTFFPPISAPPSPPFCTAILFIWEFNYVLVLRAKVVYSLCAESIWNFAKKFLCVNGSKVKDWSTFPLALPFFVRKLLIYRENEIIRFFRLFQLVFLGYFWRLFLKLLEWVRE